MFPKPKCKRQKQITFTPKHFQPEEARLKIKLQKTFKGTQSALNNFLKPAINATAPVSGMALAAKSKSLATRKAITNILNCIGGGKILSLTDTQGNGLRLKVK